MSTINAGPINENFPVTGVVNNTQTFRTNWSSMRDNLDIAQTEITELQTQVLVKSPLKDVTIDNNMNGTLISNALVSGFRHTTLNLGNNISGTLSIDVSAADVQYATVTGSISLEFTGWPTTSGNLSCVQSNVQLMLTRQDANANTVIYFPFTVNLGTTTLENYNGNGTGGFVTFPTGVNDLHFNFSTITQGATIEVQPINRPRKYSPVGTGTVTALNVEATGPGLVVANGAITTNGNISVTNTGVTQVTAGANINLSAGTGNVTITNISALSRIPLGVPNPVGSPQDTLGSIVSDGQYLYICTALYDGVNNIWKRTSLESFV